MNQEVAAQETIRATFQMILDGRSDEADASCRELAMHDPTSPDAWNLWGLASATRGEIASALRCYQRALRLDPGFVEAYNNFGSALVTAGRAEEGAAAFERALSLRPLYLPAYDNLLLTSLCLPSVAPELAAQLHRRWGELLERQVPPMPPAVRVPSDDDQRLRIGYISSEFRRHPVANFIEPVFTHHDRSRFQIFAYSNLRHGDAVTERLRGKVDAFRPVSHLTDDQLARQIRDDGIDLLIDLSGHTCGHRLGVFARRPARVQATYLGYPATTGLGRIDYRLTDAWADPEGQTEHLHSESLARLPEGFLCYTGVPLSPQSTPPCLTRPHVTFGSFNDLAKISPQVVTTWARLLQVVPHARLVLKARGLGDEGVRERVRAQFMTAGLAASRLDLLPFKPTIEEHLRSYDAIDVALDTFPYNGTTTTCDALWMSVPVTGLAGRSHVSRVGASLLGRVGLGELVARNEDEYITIAANLAADRARLAHLRAGMRERLTRSSLIDAPRFVRGLEETFTRLCQTGN